MYIIVVIKKEKSIVSNEFDCFDDDYLKYVERFDDVIKNNKRIFFSGAFGVGKTTLINKWKEYSSNKNKYVINGKKYKFIEINAFTEFHGDSFLDLLEEKMFKRWVLFIRQYYLALLIILAPIALIFLRGTTNFGLKIDLSALTVAFTFISTLIAFNQYNKNKILENRSKRLKKKCSKPKHRYLMIIDDFDRLAYLFNDNKQIKTRLDMQKENILKIISMLESTNNIVIFVGDIKSNNVNFLEKYYDYIYEFPVVRLTYELKSRLLEKWEEKVKNRGNELDIYLFSMFEDYFKQYDRKTNLRDIYRLNRHLESLNVERLNLSEVIISHYLFYIHNDIYINIFKFLSVKEWDSVIKDKKFNKIDFHDDEKLKELVDYWINVDRPKSSFEKLKGPNEVIMEFARCSTNYHIYLVNQFDNDEYTYEEFEPKILDINYWIDCVRKKGSIFDNRKDNIRINIHRFYNKLSKNSKLAEATELLLNNIDKLNNYREVNIFHSGITTMLGDVVPLQTNAINFETFENAKGNKLGKFILINIWIKHYRANETLSDQKYIEYLKKGLKDFHQEENRYLCKEWFSLIFYTRYAEYIDKEIALKFWRENKNLNEHIKKYLDEEGKLYAGNFYIKNEEYNNEIYSILNNLEAVQGSV